MALSGKMQRFDSGKVGGKSHVNTVTVTGKGILRGLALSTGDSDMYISLVVDGLVVFNPTKSEDLFTRLGKARYNASDIDKDFDFTKGLNTYLKRRYGQIILNIPFQSGFTLRAVNNSSSSNNYHRIRGTVLYAVDM